MSNDNRTIDDRLYELAQVCAAIKQGQDDLRAHLFDENLGGVIPALKKEVAAIRIDVTGIQKEKTYAAGYAAAIGTGVGFVGKYLLGKLGLHF